MATISDLRTALAAPAARFKRLANITPSADEIIRSTLFAETIVRRYGRRYLLYMPLRPDSLHSVERFVARKRYITSPVVPKMEILREEMLCGHADMASEPCDILLEPIPEGATLAEAINDACDAMQAATLVRSLDNLRETLRRADITLHNIREHNIIVDPAGMMHPIRWYYAADGTGGDDEAFTCIRTRIAELFPNLGSCPHEAAEPYMPEGHLEARPMFEGLTAVCDRSGWGFVDCHNRPVIKARFAWVGDFCEGRTAVETKRGTMGLIDKQGRYVIPPRYKIVEYDPRSGNSHVRKGSKWGVFDYSGRQTVEFGNTKPVL